MSDGSASVCFSLAMALHSLPFSLYLVLTSLNHPNVNNICSLLSHCYLSVFSPNWFLNWSTYMYFCGTTDYKWGLCFIKHSELLIFLSSLRLVVYSYKINNWTSVCPIGISSYLRTALTIVIVHIFCASRKACFKLHMHADIDIHAINYTTKCATKLKAKLSYCNKFWMFESLNEWNYTKTKGISLTTYCNGFQLKN